MQGEASTRLGFTDYFRVELAWAKLLGAVLLLAPVPARLKEWAYAAFAITLGSALIAHLSIARRPAEAWGWAAGTGRALGTLVLLCVASRARASHCEHVPTSAIEPGDKNQFIARSDALQPFEDFRFEHQPRCRRAFVGLSGGRFWLCQRRFHLTDRRHRETRHDASLGCSRCRIHQVPASTFLVVQRFRLFAQSQVAFGVRSTRRAPRLAMNTDAGAERQRARTS